MLSIFLEIIRKLQEVKGHCHGLDGRADDWPWLQNEPAAKHVCCGNYGIQRVKKQLRTRFSKVILVELCLDQTRCHNCQAVGKSALIFSRSAPRKAAKLLAIFSASRLIRLIIIVFRNSSTRRFMGSMTVAQVSECFRTYTNSFEAKEAPSDTRMLYSSYTPVEASHEYPRSSSIVSMLSAAITPPINSITHEFEKQIFERYILLNSLYTERLYSH